ncbi:MAG: LamG-like jellyroll fold domain-containing protein [Verrucomicrobiota bacterium]
MSGGQLILNNDGVNTNVLTGKYVDLPNDIAKYPALTIEAWVTWGGGDAWQRVFDFGSNSAGEQFPGSSATGFSGTDYFMLTPKTVPGANGSNASTGSLEVVFNGSSSYQMLNDSKPLATNIQAHLVLTREADGIAKLYVNGALVATTTGMVDPSTFQQLNMWLGRSNYQQDAFFKGSINEFRIYSEALSGAQIASNRERGPDDTTPGSPTAIILAGPIVNPANNHSYYLLSRNLWPESETLAQSLGGHLVTINDQVENEWVFDTFAARALEAASNTGVISLWLGLSDTQNEGTWRWANGEDATYTNWAAGQPQGGAPDEDYVGIAISFAPGKWHDIVSDRRMDDVAFGVVEVGPVPTAVTLIAESVSTSGATLKGSANPNGATTQVFFQSGLTTSYGSSTSPQTIGSGSDAVSFSALLGSLAPRTLYHYRAVAVNSAGTVYGEDQTFTTLDSVDNSVPVARDDQEGSFAGVGTALTLNVLRNDSDPDGDPLRVIAVSRPGAGRVRINADGTLTYTPRLDLAKFSGVDSFTYTVSDGFGGTARGTVLIRNPFYRIKGTYDTLLGIGDNDTQGYLKVVLTNNGAFTGTLILGGTSSALHGSFGLDGKLASPLVVGTSTLQMELVTDANGVTSIKPTVVTDSTTLTAQENAERITYNAESDPCPQAGKYTLLLPPLIAGSETRRDPSLPQGSGYAVLTVKENGTTKMTGKMGDGIAFSSAANVRRNGNLLLRAGLAYAPAGRLIGLIAFQERSQTSDLEGTLSWVRTKPVKVTATTVYPQGFALTQPVLGSRYVASDIPIDTTEQVLDTNSAGEVTLFFSRGLLTSEKTQEAKLPIGAGTVVTMGSASPFGSITMSVTPASGLFSGSFKQAGQTTITPFSGVVFQRQNLGAGVLGAASNLGGEVILNVKEPLHP